MRVESADSERAGAPAPRHRQHRGECTGAQPPPLVADEADDAEILAAGLPRVHLAVRHVQQARRAAERGALRGDAVHGDRAHDWCVSFRNRGHRTGTKARQWWRERGNKENPPRPREEQRSDGCRGSSTMKGRGDTSAGWREAGRARATRATTFPAETSRNRLENDCTETYRLARIVPLPRQRRRGPSPARLPSRLASFCRERTSSSALFHVARNPESARVTPQFERCRTCTLWTVCVRRIRTSTRGENTAREPPHVRSLSPRSSCRRAIKGVAFRPLNFTCVVEWRVESCGCRTPDALGLHARVAKYANALRYPTRLTCETRGTK